MSEVKLTRGSQIWHLLLDKRSSKKYICVSVRPYFLHNFLDIVQVRVDATVKGTIVATMTIYDNNLWQHVVINPSQFTIMLYQCVVILISNLIDTHKWVMVRVVQAGKWNFERGWKRSKMTFFGLKMWFFRVFSLFQKPTDNALKCVERKCLNCYQLSLKTERK